MRVTIAAKTMLGSLMILVLLIFVSVTGLRGLNSVSASYDDLVNRVDTIRIQAERLDASQLAKSRAVFGHLLTQDPQYQTVLDEAIRDSQDAITEMRRLSHIAEVQAILDDIEQYNQEADAILKPILAQKSFTPEEVADLLENQLPAARTKVDASTQELLVVLDEDAAQIITSVERQAKTTRAITLGISAVAIAAGLVFSLVFSRSLSRPIRAVADVARQVAEGDLRVKDLRITSRDEVGDLAAAVNQMAANLRSVLEKIRLDAESLMTASEQLSATSEAAAQALEQTSQAVAQVASGSAGQSDDAVKANSMVGQLKDAIEQIATAATKSSAEVQESANRLNQMLQQLEAMSKDASDTAAGARQASVRARDGADVVTRTLKEIEGIGSVVVESANRIKELDKLSGQIGAITEIISGIADQTNLLALNAAIEAARAGEHGRGFAVVAEEVRKLAERSASSSKQIGELIQSIQSSTADAVKAMDEGTQRVAASNQLAAEAGNALDELLCLAAGRQ